MSAPGRGFPSTRQDVEGIAWIFQGEAKVTRSICVTVVFSIRRDSQGKYLRGIRLAGESQRSTYKNSLEVELQHSDTFNGVAAIVSAPGPLSGGLTGHVLDPCCAVISATSMHVAV